MVEGGDRRIVPLEKEASGYFAGFADGLTAGARYKYRLDSGDTFPDPASRSQLEGSAFRVPEIVDPSAFPWTDSKWRGIALEGRGVIYEMHIGTFTQRGHLGQRCREPALSCRNWDHSTGSDASGGVPGAVWMGLRRRTYVRAIASLREAGRLSRFREYGAFARDRSDLRRGLDNHFGPDGNYLPEFSACYFSETKHTDWGASINFDGPAIAGPCGSSASPMPDTGLTNSIWMGSDWTRRKTSMTVRTTISLGAIAREVRV